MTRDTVRMSWVGHCEHRCVCLKHVVEIGVRGARGQWQKSIGQCRPCLGLLIGGFIVVQRNGMFGNEVECVVHEDSYLVCLVIRWSSARETFGS